MSTFDDASLVFIPSGYKTSKAYSVKPTDGSGDLAFTRSNDTATRVGPDGLIEKVRTNHALQSNTFNTTWLPTNATITSGATDPNGGTTAWTLANTAASGIIQQAATLTGLRSVSIYAKQGTHRYLYMGAYGTTDSYQVFDLQDGVIPTGSKGRIESVGNGWYRCTSFGVDGITGGVQIFPSNNSLGAGTTNGNILIWRCQYESGDIATPYIATTTAAVSVGPVANVPRLDYLGSSCPRLLLEPQRTNNALYSEQLDNAAWTKQNITITANAVTSPSGYQDADKVVETVSTGAHRALVSSAATLNGTFSFFAKAGERTKVAILSTTIDLGFDLSNGTLIDLGSGTSAGKIENYGNGWYRCSLPQASGIVALSLALLDNANNISYTGNGTSGAYFWGAQLEVGDYATSYVNTLNSAVTRGSDAASKTGISSLIGQTEGTLFTEIDLQNFDTSDSQVIAQLFQDSSNRMGLAMYRDGSTNLLQFFQLFGGSLQVNITTLASAGVFRLAAAYKNNDYVFYINGVQIGLDTTASVPTASSITLGTGNSGVTPFGNAVKQLLLFPTRLSNADLASLTA